MPPAPLAPSVAQVELAVASVKAWREGGLCDPELLDAKSGVIVIENPHGALGARLVRTLAQRLKESAERWGVAAIRVGVGQGYVVVLANVAVKPR